MEQQLFSVVSASGAKSDVYDWLVIIVTVKVLNIVIF